MHSQYPLRDLLIAALFVFLALGIVIGLLLILLRVLLRRSRATPCAEIPEAVDRHPDPCLYSQSFILQFFPGLPVTWNNPDITLTELNGVPVNSFALQPGHDYLVHTRIWDAAFSPAFGTLVRCNFHGFGFNSPASQPVETSADGTPKLAVLNIAPWQNATATFRWTTPGTEGHYCLLVECSHPADSNKWNNFGQENTVVQKARRGSNVTVQAPITNRSREHPQQVRFSADTYRIPVSEIELRLRTTEGRKRGPDAGELRFQRRGRGLARYAYKGKEALLRANESAPRAIPAGWRVGIDGQMIELAPGETRTMPVEIEIPLEAELGPISFNITSIPDRGEPGGVTIEIDVES